MSGSNCDNGRISAILAPLHGFAGLNWISLDSAGEQHRKEKWLNAATWYRDETIQRQAERKSAHRLFRQVFVKNNSELDESGVKQR